LISIHCEFRAWPEIKELALAYPDLMPAALTTLPIRTNLKTSVGSAYLGLTEELNQVFCGVVHKSERIRENP
jgi:hypothetical protein